MYVRNSLTLKITPDGLTGRNNQLINQPVIPVLIL